MKTAVAAFASMQTDSDDDEVLVQKRDEDTAPPSTTAVLTHGLRRRALSMAEAQPSVETVIVKAKRAAQSLWMLLHAQVSCSRRVRSRAQHCAILCSHCCPNVFTDITVVNRAASWRKSVHTRDVKRPSCCICTSRPATLVPTANVPCSTTAATNLASFWHTTVVAAVCGRDKLAPNVATVRVAVPAVITVSSAP